MSKDRNPLFDDAFKKYHSRFTAKIEMVEHSSETGLEVPHIVTDRFTLKPICHRLDTPEMSQLFTSTFASQEVMASFGSGNVYSLQDFEGIIARHTNRWSSGYQFASFIVTHNEESEGKEYDVVLGFEGLNDHHEQPNSCQIGYALNQSAQSLGKAGSETVGTLVLTYGQWLFDNKVLVNRSDSNFKEPKGDLVYQGEEFQKIYSTVRTDNAPSAAILKGLGFEEVGVVTKYEDERIELIRGFYFSEALDIQCLGITTPAIPDAE